LLSDGFDHLDRYDPVEATAQVSIVCEPDLDPLAQPHLLDVFLCQGSLLGRNSDGENRTDHRAEPRGQLPPAAADLEHALASLEVQQAHDPLKLGVLSLLERLAGMAIERR
jgi:hypothetical protein